MKMAIKMKTVTSFYNEDGSIITESEQTATVPGIEEIEKEDPTFLNLNKKIQKNAIRKSRCSQRGNNHLVFQM
jgi:uncharacterized membrane protein